VSQTKQAIVDASPQSLYVLGKCFDVPGWNDTNGTDVQIYDCHGSTNQQWELWADGTVRPAFNTNKCLDLPGWQTANGTPIQIYDCTGGSNQQWRLGLDIAHPNLQGFGGKCVDVPGFQTTDGTNLQYFDCNGGANQKVKLAPPMASAHVFWNLKAEEESMGSGQGICLGSVYDPTPFGETEPGLIAVARNCDGDLDQLWQPIGYDGVSVRLQTAATDYSGNPLCLDDWNDTTNPSTGNQLSAADCGRTPAEQLFQYTYVESDESGFPCYAIQNTASGKYIGVANAQANPVQQGMDIITWIRTPSDDQLWCDHSATTGFFTAIPDFVITNVIYAPPGKSSSIQYQSSTTVGSALSSTQSFQNSTDVSASASVGVMMNGGMVGASVTYDHTFGDSDTSEVDQTTTWSQGNKVPGETNGINHDWDQIWFMVRPILNMSFTPGIAGTPNATNWQFGQGDGETTDITGWVYAGELNGDFALNAQDQNLFTVNNITSDMYPTILQADAFFQGISPIPGMDTDRFDYINQFSYQPPPEPLMQGQMASTQPYIVTQSTTTSDTKTSSYSNSVNVTYSGGFAVGPFKETESVANKWTWTHSSSNKESTGTGLMDTLTVGQPDFGYNGPGFLHVYMDRIFKTYAFTLDYAGPAPFTNDSSYGCEVGGVVMHCCPPGNAMVGIRLDQNVFKCGQLQDASGPIVADNSTYRTVYRPNSDGTSTPYTMHTCPFGYVMVGLHEDLNILACQQIPPNAVNDAITGELVDTGTQDGYPMHACEATPHAYAMSGFDGADNLLTCATNPGLL
jgi:hypothetical protein